MKAIKKALSNFCYTKACNLCEWLEKRLFDEMSWKALDDENSHLRNRIDELKHELDYLQDIA